MSRDDFPGWSVDPHDNLLNDRFIAAYFDRNGCLCQNGPSADDMALAVILHASSEQPGKDIFEDKDDHDEEDIDGNGDHKSGE